MIRTLFAQERVVRLFPLLLPAAALLALLLSWPLQGVLSVLDADDLGRPGLRDEGLGGVYAFLVLSALQGLVFIAPLVPLRTRVREHERALPVSMRALVLGRLAVTWVALVAPVLITSVVFAARLPEGAAARSLLLSAANAASGATLAVLVGFAWRPRALRLGLVETIGIAVLGLGLVLLPGSIDEPRLALVYLAASLAVALWLHRSVPVVIPAERPLERAAGQGGGGPAWSRVMSPLRWTLLRSGVLRPHVLLLLPVLVAVPATLGRNNLVFLVWFPLYIPMLVGAHALAMLNGLDSLPLRRSRLLPYVALPSLVALVAAACAWLAAPYEYRSYETLSRRVEPDRFREQNLAVEADYATHLRVPPSLWVLAAGDAAPRVTAPWGESVEPLAHPVFWGVPVSVHNPYDVAPDSSVRFLAWQASRALRQAYGIERSPDELLSRWFGGLSPTARVGDVVFRTRDVRPWEDLAPADPLDESAVGFALLLALLAWLGTLAFVLRPNVPPLSRERWRRRRLRGWLGNGLAAAFLLVLMVHSINDDAVLPVLASVSRRALDGLLGSSPVAWAVLDLAVLVAGWLYLRRRIQRIEVLPPPKHGWQRRQLPVY